MSAAQPHLAVLASAESTLSQVMQAIASLDAMDPPRRACIGVSASVTVDLLGVCLRRQGWLAGARLDIVQGNYDDPIGDIDRFLQAGVEQMILLPFFDNLLPSFEAQLETLPADVIDAREAELRGRYRIVFDKARGLGRVFLCTLHRMGSPAEPGAHDATAMVLARFNQALREEAATFSHVSILDSEDVVRSIGHRAAFDTRFYFRSKAPYTSAYLNELARRVAVASRGFGAYFYKVLALDCDNTLWGGVIGEDLLEGIKLGPHDYPGNVFWRMQHEFVALQRHGVLLCLCSKNNPADVDEVLRQHPAMVLRDEHLVAKRVNWEDKPSNLRALAHDLNVGLDSIVFLDDSAFECEAVRQQLPMVKVLQVPAALTDYPRVAAEIKRLFLGGGITADGRDKTAQYRQRAQAVALRAQFNTQEAYLASLELQVELTRNARDSVARISELSQKSNQFNLTTLRYSAAQVEQMMGSTRHAVFSLVVRDRFGSAGLTGVAVMRYAGAVAHIENFFMSCRVIGRGIETSIWSRIAADARGRGCTELQAEFIPSAKNAQVTHFYDRLGLPMVGETGEGVRRYAIALAAFDQTEPDWIEIRYVE